MEKVRARKASDQDKALAFLIADALIATTDRILQILQLWKAYILQLNGISYDCYWNSETYTIDSYEPFHPINFVFM